MVSEITVVGGAVVTPVIGSASTLDPHVKESSPPANPGVVGGGVAASGKNPSPPPPSQSSASSQDVLAAMHKMKDYMQSVDLNLHFSVDDKSGIIVVKVVDPSTNKVVHQIPSEEVMSVVHSLEGGGGLLSRIKA